MNKNSVLNFLKKYAAITLGCILYSLGIALFLDANKIASGGATGISILINYLFPFIDTGLILLIINIPMFIMGWIIFGKQFVVSTAYATIASSLLISFWQFLFDDVLQLFPFTDNLLISAVCGASLFGIGMGIIFRMGASTAGTDIFVKWLRTKFRYLKTGLISMVTDLTIVTVSVLFMHDWGAPITQTLEGFFYSVLAIVVFTFMFDFVLYGGRSAKLIYIIVNPEKAESLKTRIINELDLGATFLDAKGAYSGEDKTIFLCAVKNIYYPKLRDVVYEEDDHAFLIVTSAKEIFGEGYKSHKDEEL
ncbi:MAG: YitT family protein [Clostridiales bacterium]|nr:YitT family protein [Clostridiales bacterium]